MLVRQQEPFPQPDEPPVVIGKMVQIPYVTVPLYAAWIALGWFGGEQWRNKPEPQLMTQPVAHAALVPLNRTSIQPAVKNRGGSESRAGDEGRSGN